MRGTDAGRAATAMVWSGLVAGTAGWLLLAAGAGKLTSDRRAFRNTLAAGDILPAWIRPALTAGVAPAELIVGIAVLTVPAAYDLIPAGLLFGAFAAFQVLLLARRLPTDCGCYGRIRLIRYGPWTVAAYGLLAMGSFAAAITGGAEPLLLRLVGGAALAVAVLGVLGARWTERRARFPYAEVLYVRRRLAGDSDAVARQAVASDFGFHVRATYRLVPRDRAMWLMFQARRQHRRPA